MCRLRVANEAGDLAVGPYVVLARKWRPAQFSDIVGQSHIVRTLTNAILSERIHQAYLFTGSRGIGKTSIARIFAKVIRCETVQNINGILRSCDQCSNCKEITGSTSVDVIEIDGASNNGVEAVREIRENAKYMPSSGTRKIYIIDEVHMLTTAAFNALLKTLEEPPAHIIFVFATTEPHKIPATILSRCQRFDYRRVTLQQIQTRLSEVILAEHIQAEPGVLALMARAAEGSMRDALSLLDQVIAFAGAQISLQSVRESIGLIEGQSLIGILKGIFERKPLDALSFVEQTFQRGHDLRVLTRNLIEFLHGVLLAKIGSPHAAALELSEEEWKELQEISQLRTLEEIELIFQVLHNGLDWIARSPQPKIVLDVLLIKCAMAESLLYIETANGAAGPTSLPSPQSASGSIPPSSPISTLGTSTVSSIVSKLAASVSSSPKVEPTAPAATVSTLPTFTPAVLETSVTPPKAKTWEGFIEHVRKSRPLLASILEHSSTTTLPSMETLANDRCLTICFSPQEAYFR
jgi:DNA polymerase-3 subunit gamma/tau